MGPTGPQFTLVDPVSSNVASREIHEGNGVLIATSSINDGFSISTFGSTAGELMFDLKIQQLFIEMQQKGFAILWDLTGVGSCPIL